MTARTNSIATPGFWRLHSPLATMTGLAVLLACLAVFALRLGSSPVATQDLVRWLLPFLHADEETAAIMLLRWPRVVTAILGGAMIAASGYILQVVSRNGLADPGLLGISQGTMAAVVLGAAVFAIDPRWLAVTGLGGGLLTAAFVLLVARRLASTTGLILVGIAVSIVLGAMIEIVMVEGGILQFARWLAWSHGSLTVASASGTMLMLGWAAVLLPAALIMGRQMAPLMLGADQAAGVGASPKILVPVLTLLSAALVAPIVASVGPISFLGLIAAHIARRLAGERPVIVMPVAMLSGAILLLAADTAGRTLFLPVIVPAGILVSLVGVAAFLIAARLSRSER
jgi:iron complex transport system permease protein